VTFSTDKLTVGESDIHGLGCFAATHISPGEVIGFFDGFWYLCPMGPVKPIYPDNVDSRFCIDVTTFKLGPRTFAVILDPLDGSEGTPLDRINHSDEPNCTARGLAVIAAGPIRRGTELTINYDDLNCTPLVLGGSKGAVYG